MRSLRRADATRDHRGVDPTPTCRIPRRRSGLWVFHGVSWVPRRCLDWERRDAPEGLGWSFDRSFRVRGARGGNRVLRQLPCGVAKGIEDDPHHSENKGRTQSATHGQHMGDSIWRCVGLNESASCLSYDEVTTLKTSADSTSCRWQSTSCHESEEMVSKDLENECGRRRTRAENMETNILLLVAPGRVVWRPILTPQCGRLRANS